MKFLICLSLCIAVAQAGLLAAPVTSYAAVAPVATYSAVAPAVATYSSVSPLRYNTYAAAAPVYRSSFATYAAAPAAVYTAPITSYAAAPIVSSLWKK